MRWKVPERLGFARETEGSLGGAHCLDPLLYFAEGRGKFNKDREGHVRKEAITTVIREGTCCEGRHLNGAYHAIRKERVSVFRNSRVVLGDNGLVALDLNKSANDAGQDLLPIGTDTDGNVGIDDVGDTEGDLNLPVEDADTWVTIDIGE